MLKLLDILRSFIPSFESLPNISSVSGAGPGVLFGALGTVAISLFGLSIGRTRSVISLLSIYVAFVFDRVFPYLKELNNVLGNSFEEYWVRLAMFLIAYIAVFLIFNFSFIRRKLSSGEYSLFGIMILSILQLGLLVSIIFNILPRELSLKYISGFSVYFSNSTALFIWALAPLPVLFFIKK